MPRELETYLTLDLDDVDTSLAEIHRRLYPERIPEQIPFSITLLYPWKPRHLVTDADLDELATFFRSRQPLTFQLVGVAEFPGMVAYLVPEPCDELRSLMRDLWRHYPAYPPYGIVGGDPPPHATLGRLDGEHAITREQAEQAVQHVLPVSYEVREATLMEEEVPDRLRIWQRFPFKS